MAISEDLTLLSANPFSFLERKEVPKLPIPNLSETLERYLRQVQPLLSYEEYERTSSAVREFQKSQGPSLDEELHRLAAESPTSWLEGFWDTGYLEFRVPNPINVNPFFLIHPTVHMSQLQRASEIVSSSIRLWEAIKSGNFPVEKSRGENQCMTSYWRVFATCRIPKPRRDELYTCPTSKHILVMSNNRMYSLNVYDNDGVPCSATALEESLSTIQKHSLEGSFLRDGSCEGGIGLWTCENRDLWSSIRAQFVREKGNERMMRVVDSSILVLCLDQVDTKGDADYQSQIMLHGENGENRWFDKLQLIVCKDGSAAFNMEHAPHDGHTLLLCTTYIFDEITGKKEIPAAPAKSTAHKAPLFQYLQWNLNSELIQTIHTAKHNMKEFIEQTQTSVLSFNHFGADVIKKVKLSPDAFVQMAYQIAYFRITGNVQSTYESCNMKGYYHGRTETIRSVSMESKLMCENFFMAATPPFLKNKLIRDAAARHGKTGQDAKAGRGVDRHLLGLQQLARHRQLRLPQYNIPEIFIDPAYAKFCGSILSTSNCGGYALDLFGFGPVMPTGLGIGYIIKPDCLLFNVTSFIGQAKLFTSVLRATLLDMLQLCGANPPSSL